MYLQRKSIDNLEHLFCSFYFIIYSKLLEWICDATEHRPLVSILTSKVFILYFFKILKMRELEMIIKTNKKKYPSLKMLILYYFILLAAINDYKPFWQQCYFYTSGS